jgi:hypothetical protein
MIQTVKKYYDKQYGFNIAEKTRKRHKVNARKSFNYLFVNLHYTHQEIGNILNIDHSTSIHYKNTLYTISERDKIIFNKIVDAFDLDVEKFEIKEIKPKEIKREKLKGILQDFNILLELDNKSIEEFKETRLMPFMRMKQIQA